MPDDSPLELEMRRRIFETVEKYPGLHVREVARQVDTSVALVEYHLPFLTKRGLLQAEKDGNTLRLYARGAGADMGLDVRRKLSVLRAQLPLQVVLHLANEGARKHGEICEALSMSKSKLSFHLRKLEGVGLVQKLDGRKFGLVDAEEVQELLVRHRPTADLRDRFADMWIDFYEAA